MLKDNGTLHSFKQTETRFFLTSTKGYASAGKIKNEDLL
jgi:hypothetical protein